MEQNVLLLVAVILGATSLLLLRHRRRCSHHLPPSPPISLPILGHLHYFLTSEPPHRVLASLSSRLKAPILHLRLGHVPAVVVSSPFLARSVLRTHDAALSSRPRLLSAEHLSFGCSDVTFSPSGPYWRQARRICVSELLAQRRVATFKAVRDEETARLMQRVAAAGETEVDVSREVLRLANDVLCRVAFGRRMDGEVEECGEEENGRKKRKLGEVMEEAQALFAGMSAEDFYPEWEGVLSRLTGMKGRMERCVGELRKVCDLIIEEHESKWKESGGSAGGTGGCGGESEVKEDFVDVLLRVKRSSDLEIPITDDNLKALVLV